MDDKEYKKIITQFRLAAGVTLAVLASGMIFYHYTEHLNWVDSLYFCVITLTTIGYGDIVPTTTAGKLFTTGYVLIGIGIIATFANLTVKPAMAHRIDHQQRKAKK